MMAVTKNQKGTEQTETEELPALRALLYILPQLYTFPPEHLHSRN